MLKVIKMDKSNKVCALYIASLRGLAIIYQQCHWTTKGSSFYGDHLLFERLYNNTLKDLDMAAEKFIGTLGDECLEYDLQNELLGKFLVKYSNLDGSPVEMSLTAEKDFLKFSVEVYNILEEEGKMTQGIDDMILGISNSREESVYLLQQILKG
jgi:DNA-binding ferritin-like protein